MTHKGPDKIEDLLGEIKWHIERRKYRLSEHCITRQKQRLLSLPDILHVLMHGFHEEKKTKFHDEFQSWNYAIRGKTLDLSDVRVIVAFEKDMVIITAIRLQRKNI